MANTYLTRTVTSAGNRKTWTFSCWVKRLVTSTNTTGYDSIFSTNISNEGINIAFGNGAFTNVGDYFEVTHADAAGGGTTDWSVRTNQLFRDTAGWYHLVVAFDTTQSTTADRVKIYVNGVEVDKTVTTGPALNTDYEINNTQQHTIGRWQRDGNSYFDGNLAHFHFCDGTAYAASDFGQTDSTTGIWTPKGFSGSYGTNGFFLKFENSGAMGTDSSGNSNTWAVSGGTLTQTQDTPTNNFATLQIMYSPINSGTSIFYGNLYFVSGTGSARDMDKTAISNIPVNKGKWYCEVKLGTQGQERLGAGPNQGAVINGGNNNRYAYIENDGQKLFQDGTGETVSAYMGNPSNGDIMMMALDMDNQRLYVGTNGLWADGSGSTDQASPSGYIDLSTGTMLTNQTDLPGYAVFQLSSHDASTSQEYSINFGNGYFGTTAVSSGNADGDGYGVFEYEPPTGYYALCTKNIASYG